MRTVFYRCFALQLACAAAALCLVQTARGSIVNGGFEGSPGSLTYIAVPGGSTLIGGWTTTHTGVEWFLPSAYSGVGWTNSPDGGWAVDIANLTHSAGGIEQTFATVPGTSYQIDFYYGTSAAYGYSGTAEITVAVGSTSQTYSIANAGSAIVWEARSFSFTATSASSTVSFLSLQNANLHFAFIDGVTLIPTPSAVALMGLGGLAVLRRRR